MSEPWLEVRIEAKEREAQDVVRLELADLHGRALPEFTAGAHIDVAVTTTLVRQYSLCNDPIERQRYVIGVLRESQSRGGSLAVHDHLLPGHTLRIRPPRNHFALDATASRYVLFAGGIGVTPILAMSEYLHRTAKTFEVHYCARTRTRAAFTGRIATSSFAKCLSFHFDDGPAEQRLDIDRALVSPTPTTHLYVCGPPPFIDFLLNSARARGWAESTLHREFFTNLATKTASPAGSFEIQLRSTGQIFTVPPEKTIVEILREAGITVEVSCEQGVCGTCVTRVLEGIPDHRDAFLTDAEHRQNEQMTLCCSRAKSARLVLDL